MPVKVVTGPDGEMVLSLSVACPWCRRDAGWPCITVSGRQRGPHVARVKLAQALAADADPALDEFFPKRGQCQLCGTPGLDQRHRVVDAIAERAGTGETDAELAGEFMVTVAAVRAVREWAKRWGVS